MNKQIDLAKERQALQDKELELTKESDEYSKYKPKGKQERAARRQIYERFYDMRDDEARAEAEEDWEMADKEYVMPYPTVASDDWQAHLHLPDAWAAIQAQAMETIERKARPKPIPTESSDEPIAELSDDLMNYNMDTTGFDYQYYLAKLSASIRGTSFLMDYWRTEKRIVKDPTDVDENGEIVYKDKEIIDFDDDYTEWVPNEFIFVDEKADHIDNANDMFKRELININDFHRIYDNKPGFENAKYVVQGADTTTKSYFDMPPDADDVDVEVLHYYNRAIDAYWVAANNVVIHMGPLPTKHKELPLAVQYQYRIPGRFWGVGIPRVVHYLSEERKSIRNMNMDRQKLGLNKSFLHNNAFDLDDEDLITGPSRLISLDTNGQPLSQAIQPIEYGDVPQSYFKTEDILLEDIRRAHGIDDRIQGVNVGGTATEAALLKESSVKRINMISIASEMDTILRLGRIKWSNIQFFYPIPRIQAITTPNEGESGTKYKTITTNGRKYSIIKDKEGKSKLSMEEVKGKSAFKIDKQMAKYLQGSFDIIIDSDIHVPLSRAIHQAQVTQTLSLLLSNPYTAGALDPNKAASRAWKAIDEDPDKWLAQKSDTNEMRMLANRENAVMMAGEPLSPTEGANEEHTLVHLNFTQTVAFQELPEHIQQIIGEHIIGENEANPNTGPTQMPSMGGGAAPGGGSVSPGTQQPGPQLSANTSQPQPQVADLQGANFAQE